MTDRNERDEKVIAIPYGDPQYNSYKDIKQLPAHIFEELMHFLKVYKQLENKPVEIKELGGRERAVEIIEEALELYKTEILKDKKD